MARNAAVAGQRDLFLERAVRRDPRVDRAFVRGAQAEQRYVVPLREPKQELRRRLSPVPGVEPRRKGGAHEYPPARRLGSPRLLCDAQLSTGGRGETAGLRRGCTGAAYPQD